MNLIEQIKVNDVSIDGYQGTYYSESPEYVQLTTDAEGKILEGIKSDGTKHIGGNLIVDGSIYNDSLNVEQVIEEIQKRVDEVLESASETLSYFEPTDNPEWLQVTTDSSGRVLGGRKTDGTVVENVKIITKSIDADELNLSSTAIASLKEELNIVGENNILTQNPSVDLLPKLYNLKKGYYYQDTPKVEPLVLLHFTDLHLYDNGMDTIKLFQTEYSTFIDDAIHTGDFYDMGIVDGKLSHWDNKWLNVIGNHDAVIYNETY